MQVIAHRGASGYAPENTMASFKRAILMGADGIELDVQMTRDGEVVVIHDWTLERTTNGTGEVKEKTLEELKKLDAGSWYGNEFKGEKILTLKEVLEVIPKDFLLNIEIKSRYSEANGIESKIIELIKDSDVPLSNIIISSFSHKLLKKISDKDKGIKLGFLFSGDMLNIWEYLESLKVDFFSLHPNQNFISKELAEENTKYQIYSWTVNEKKDLETLKEFKIQGVITNYPDKMIKLLKSL